MANLALSAAAMSLLGSAQAVQYAMTNFSNSETSLTLLYQNNLNSSDDVNHVGAILLDPASQELGASYCAELGEALLPLSILESHTDDFENSLSYLAYAGLVIHNQSYYVADATLSVNYAEGGKIALSAFISSNGEKALPVLCTQSSNANNATNAVPTESNEIRVSSSGNTFVGFRNQKSFRFSGIPYTNPVQRFEYSTVYNSTGQVINATHDGPHCVQIDDDDISEDCLFLNIQTPYIPRVGSSTKLRPVLFVIHGGAFTGGYSSANSGLDGGNMAAREDIVVVELNYRLSTLGFLAVPGTDVRGNYGIGDQITALEWVKDNIASFGGDPSKVTINGESAGAGSVRVLLGSPPVIENSLIAGGIAQSNLGGGVGLGLESDYATTYSSYLTIDQSYALAGQQIFTAVGCNQTDVEDQIACLKTVDAATIINLDTVARYVVQDGTIVNTEELIVSERNGSAAYVPVIFGTTANEGASIATFPLANTTDEAEGLAYSLSISQEEAQRVIDSGLFPYYDSGNLTLDTFNVSQRVATDMEFRCVDEATMYAASVSGVFPRSYYYTIYRTYEGYDPNGLGPDLIGGPDSNPELPYFRLHGSELGFTTGNQYPFRDDNDLKASQLITGYFGEFTKSGQPNPSVEYLQARGYNNTLQAVMEAGPWDLVIDETGPAKNLNWPSPTVDFPDIDQCVFLNYSVTYYLDGGS